MDLMEKKRWMNKEGGRSEGKKELTALRPRQNGRHFPDDILKGIFLNENIWISISLKFVPKGPINNIPSLVQIMAWRRPGAKPLSEPMMVSLPMYICVTRPQWVKEDMKEGMRERKGKERKGKERKGKERKGKVKRRVHVPFCTFLFLLIFGLPIVSGGCGCPFLVLWCDIIGFGFFCGGLIFTRFLVTSRWDIADVLLVNSHILHLFCSLLRLRHERQGVGQCVYKIWK